MGGVGLRNVSLMNLILPLTGTFVVFFACLHAGAWPLAVLLVVEQAVLWRALASVVVDASFDEEETG